MPLNHVPPPAFAGLVWTDYTAPATERFWTLYNHRNRTGKQDLSAVGITASKSTGAWIVHFQPRVVDAEEVANAITTLELEAFSIGRDKSEHQRVLEQQLRTQDAQRREMRDWKRDRARRTLVDRFGNLADQDLVAAARKAGMSSIAQWGAFCVNKSKMHSFTDLNARISLIQAVRLLELVDQTAAKAESVRHNLNSTGNEVDWPDDEVVRAVERLTWDDHDRASAENGLGWSKADSSKGHWCHGMIKRGGADRSIGIDAARAIVGKYAGQLGREQGKAA